MIIAEASVQHEGDVARAMEIASDAAIVGDADAVKFQLFVPDEPLFCPLEGDDKRWPKWTRSCMPLEDWQRLKAHCDEIGIELICSVFQMGGVEIYKQLGCKWWKVASRAAVTFPYEEAGGPFIVSLGLGPKELEQEDLSIVPDYGRDQAKLLQCEMRYPHEPLDFNCQYDGLSDHSGSAWPSINALALGAKIIEVHVAFGDDKKPEELTIPELYMICEARDAFAALC